MGSLKIRPRLESMDERCLPSGTLWTQTDTWTGPVGNATVTVTVTEYDIDTFKWNYHVHNDSYVIGQDDWGIAYLIIPVEDSEIVTDIGSSIDDAETGTNSGLDETGDNVWWLFGSEWEPGLLPGMEADFWFSTPPQVVMLGGGSGWEPGVSVDTGGVTVGPADWPEMDDVPDPYEEYVNAGPGFTDISQVTAQLSKDAAAKELLDAAVNNGVKIASGAARTGAKYDPNGNNGKGEIVIDPVVNTTLDKSAGMLLYELLRYKYRKDQLELDNKAGAGTITRDEYATKCEELSYKYMKEQHEIASKAVTAGTWGAPADYFGAGFKAGNPFETFDKYLAYSKTPGAGGKSHYQHFQERYDYLRTKK